MARIDINIPEPNEKQKLFLSDQHRYIAFGGARGGGKSWSVRVKAVLLAFRYAGIKQMIMRRTYPELYANHIKPLLQMLPQGTYKYNDSKKEVIFPNGSSILFRYCNNDKDLLNYQGTEVDILYIDEATQFTEEQYKILIACVRGVNNFPKRVYLTCNAGGIGHQWVKRLFITKSYKDGEKPEEYSFIQSLVTDNKALLKEQPEYISQLEALPPKLREAWLYGNWDIFEGQFFEDFIDRPENYDTRQWTHVINPFDIPEGWTVFRAFDWGYHRPFACGWYAVDYDGVIYHILELYGCNGTPNEGIKWTPPQVFAEIHRIETEHPWLKGRKINGVADPSIWDAQTGESIADVAAKHQVYFTAGDNKRIAGWMQCHYRLAFDENGFPMFYVFKNCEHFIRTIPLLQYDEHKVEDLATDGTEDHIADSWRYGLMSRPIKPRVPAKPDKYADNPLNIYLDIAKTDLGTRQHRPRMQIIDDGGNDGEG